MDINKTDMFEKFFNGFQEKFIEAFMAAGEEKILVRILENQKASKEEYRTYFNCAWEFLEKTTIAEQQAKVDELQKRVDSILKVVQSMRNEVKHGHLSEDESQTLSSYADDLEQALKGEQP
ncbi:hypothetical protein [Acinetobacter pittii]|uniref:hypothetical protein n=1 Tax=Acinetobacter pittii TaxID=48296 RepID=UPI002270858C|nr:hypothetical protein [Acinetobacter pittii]